MVALLAIGVAACIISVATPGHAYQVQIQPSSPQLGDTLSITVQAENSRSGRAPAITMNSQTYPTFPLAANQFRALIPTSPLDRPNQRLEIKVTGEEETRNLAVWLGNRSFPTQRITLPPGKAGLSGTDYEFDRVAAFKQLVTPEKFWNGPMLRPSQGRVSSIYGVRRYYNGVFAENYYHRGVDYAASTGTPIVAPAAGRIALVGREADGFRLHGNTVGIDHGQGVAGIFIHMSRIDVAEGDFVQAGQVIGRIGSTGSATGPHLHWGLYVHGVAVDPVPWRYDGIE
ncbi:MAG: M23 family metallopeptidase [Cyanothece sp. SIO1E1]|nr:M23 family metallopeptidase [Cyanothece sp. SIO1E1]